MAVREDKVGMLKPIEHTSDIGFEVWAESLESLFTEAAFGMLNLMVEVKEEYTPMKFKDVSIEGEDIEDLLFGFLSEILYLFEVESFVPVEISFYTLTPNILKAKIGGIPFNPREHTLHIEIKAVTYCDMKIEKKGKYFTTKVIFDV